MEKYARQQRRQAKYPWRKYKQLPEIPDYVDRKGRFYYHSDSKLVQLYEVRPNQILFEIKLPISRKRPPLHFPDIGETIFLHNVQENKPYKSFKVDSIFYAPRGATGICIGTI